MAPDLWSLWTLNYEHHQNTLTSMTRLNKDPNLQECQSQGEHRVDYDTSIHSNPDALAWAKFFVDTCQKNQFHIGTAQGVMTFTDVESWMLTWFANAMMDAKRDAKANFDSWMDAIADCFPEDHPCRHCKVTGETVIDAIKDLQKQLVKSCQDRIEDEAP